MSQRHARSSHLDIEGVTHWLIHQAAHRAPEPLISRLEEEWLADLECRFSALSRLRFALGCCWATLVILKDSPRSRIVAAGSAAPAGGIVTLADRNFGYFSLRSATLFLIAGLHVALFYGLVTTLSHVRTSTKSPDLQNYVVKPISRDRLPPTPAPRAEMKPFAIDVPKPVVDTPRNFEVESDVTADVAQNSPEGHLTPSLPETPTHAVRQVAGGPGAGFPDTADFYPMLSIHLEEQGFSTLRVCVDRKGRLTSAPTIINGSGSARLDAGALKLARAGSGHYRATIEDGQAVDSCFPLGVRFELKK